MLSDGPQASLVGRGAIGDPRATEITCKTRQQIEQLLDSSNGITLFEKPAELDGKLHSSRLREMHRRGQGNIGRTLWLPALEIGGQ